MKSKHACVETLETRIAPAAVVFSLSGLDGNNGFTLVGAAAGDYAGESVSNAGDVNGDGFDDVIVGASGPNSFTGAAYVVFGKAGGFAASVDLAALDGTSGFKITGAAQHTGSGIAVSAAGDLNGDGFDDLIVGLQFAANEGGVNYVVFGKQSGWLPSSGPDGIAILGGEGVRSGNSVSAAGDVNGDGFDDLIIGAHQTDRNGIATGAAYVFFGKAVFQNPFLALSTLTAEEGFKLTGVLEGDRAGYSVSGAGDINSDGFDDIIIGAPATNATPGNAYVVFGKGTAFEANIDLATLNGSNGFKLSGASYAGIAVSSAGDVNGDGFDDVVVGAHGVSSPTAEQSGAAYVVFGKATPFAADLALSALDGTNGFKMAGATLNERVGWSVSGAGDFNADGFDDLIIGGASPDPDKPGTSYLVYGKSNGHAPNIDLADLSSGDGFQLVGATDGDFAGWEVSDAGDLNGDGRNDVIIGATRADGKGEFTGAAYVVFGRAVEIRISDASLIEANAGVSQLEFVVTLSGAATLPVTVKVGSENGTAVSGSDFIALAPTTLTFAPGETSKTVTIDIAGDTLFEGNETFSILLSEANGAVVRDGIGIGTISNDDVLPDVTISGGSVVEGGDGSGSLAFTISLDAPSGLPTTVHYTTEDLTAIAGEDYTAMQGLLTFAPGETSKTVAINVAGDKLFETDETFSILLSNPQGGVIREGTGIGTISNDDEPPVVTISGSSLLEGGAGSSSLVFTINLDAPSGLPTTVRYATANGSALAGEDYTPAEALLTFSPSETSKVIRIEISNDTLFEADETFSIFLSDAEGGVIREGIGIGTIANDDAPPGVTIAGGSLLEGEAGSSSLVFTINLDAPSGLPTTLQYATIDGSATAGEDYTSVQALLTFAPGETSKTVTVDIASDMLFEADETFSILLTGVTGGIIRDGISIGTISNDDAPPVLSISGGSVREGDAGSGNLVFTISLDAPSGLPATVQYATSNGSAIAGEDYTSIDGLLTFAPGETEKTVSIPLTSDTVVEAHETLSVALSNATGATVGSESATGTILNDETRVLINDGTVLEGHDGIRTMTFTVSLTMETMLPVSVDLASLDGTATAGVDYVAILPATLHFAPGETSQTITVEILGDIDFEQSEDFSLVLGSAVNAVIEDGTGTGTILNDDVTLLGKRKATYIDEDGDIVSIKVSKGTLKVEDFTLVPAGVGSRLALVDFSGEEEFSRTNLSITAQRALGAEKGPRSVDVGHIDASGVDLGKVVIKGDLGRIDSGNALDAEPGLLSLVANSLGARGSETQLPGGSLLSQIDGMLKTVKIAGSVTGADLSVSGDLKSVKITGDLLGSTIQSDGRIGSIQVGGDLAGTDEREARISAQGLLSPASASKAVAIGLVSVRSSVDHAEILAGYDRSGAATNADAGIGSITVGLDWIASDIAAGAFAGLDGVFGTDDDARIGGGNSIVARIASIQIKGTVPVSDDAGTSHYGFVAEEIAAFKLGSDKVELSRGPGNDLAGVLAGAATNLMIREVS